MAFTIALALPELKSTSLLDLTQRLDSVLAQLRQDPFAPSLRLHALSGALDGLQAVSVNYAYRIVLCVEVKEHEVILHNIGTHDEVYG